MTAVLSLPRESPDTACAVKAESQHWGCPPKKTDSGKKARPVYLEVNITYVQGNLLPSKCA